MILDREKLRELRVELDELRSQDKLNATTFNAILEQAAQFCTAAPFFLESFIRKAPGDWIQKYIVPAVAPKSELVIPVLKKAQVQKRLAAKVSTENTKEPLAKRI